MSEILASIDVQFRQHGEWGGKTFTAHLRRRRPDPSQDIFESLDDADIIELLIADADSNGPWAGRCYRPGDIMHGRFAGGSTSPLCGCLYRGEMEVEGVRLPPSVVHPGRPGHLHVGDQDVSPEQRDLLFLACYADSPARFSAGASVSRLIPPEEVEARTRRQAIRSK